MLSESVSDSRGGVLAALDVLPQHHRRFTVVGVVQSSEDTGGPFMAELLYGSGLRVSECVALRVKDLVFSEAAISVRIRVGRTLAVGSGGATPSIGGHSRLEARFRVACSDRARCGCLCYEAPCDPSVGVGGQLRSLVLRSPVVYAELRSGGGLPLL